MATDFTQFYAQKYICKFCDFNTSKKNDYTRHTLTQKHKNHILATNGNEFSAKSAKTYICEFCEKEYNDRTGLWKHKKKCNKNISDKTNQTPDITPELINLITELVKGQNGIQESIVELCKNVPHNTTNSHNNNSNNKSFNLQFFLNETCKDAMNIMDFVDSIKLQLSDLERVGELGYVEGISNIIVKNLNNLDVTQRPVHCTDKKREVLYVKDEDKWEKEDESKEKIHKVIKKVALKNQRMIPKFKEEHPDCGKSTSKFSDQYNKIILEAMGGTGNNDKEKEERIVKNISKHITLDK
jgi:ribosomal protein L37AE/L43A